MPNLDIGNYGMKSCRRSAATPEMAEFIPSLLLPPARPQFREAPRRFCRAPDRRWESCPPWTESPSWHSRRAPVPCSPAWRVSRKGKWKRPCTGVTITGGLPSVWISLQVGLEQNHMMQTLFYSQFLNKQCTTSRSPTRTIEVRINETVSEGFH